MAERSTNYYSTFISVAEDCPVNAASEPPASKGKMTAAQIHLRMARDEAGSHTQEQILFRTYLNAKALNSSEHVEGGETWKVFFSKGQPCLRTSALGKRYGWGLHFDEVGRVTAVPMESSMYVCLANDPDLRQLKAMRSRRG